VYHATLGVKVMKKQKVGGKQLPESKRHSCAPWARHSRHVVLLGCGRGAAREEDAQGIPTKTHISPSILAYEDKIILPGCVLELLQMDVLRNIIC